MATQSPSTSISGWPCANFFLSLTMQVGSLSLCRNPLFLVPMCSLSRFFASGRGFRLLIRSSVSSRSIYNLHNSDVNAFQMRVICRNLGGILRFAVHAFCGLFVAHPFNHVLITLALLATPISERTLTQSARSMRLGGADLPARFPSGFLPSLSLSFGKADLSPKSLLKGRNKPTTLF